MKRFFTENTALKLSSLLAALLLWAYVGTSQMIERRETVQLEFAGIPAGLSLGPGVRGQVTAVFSGRRDPIRLLNPEEVKAVVQFRPGVPVGSDFVVTPHLLNMPKGVTADVANLKLRLIKTAVAPPIR